MLKLVCFTLLVNIVFTQRLQTISAPANNYVTEGKNKIDLNHVSTEETFQREDQEWAKPGMKTVSERVPEGTTFDGSCDWTDEWAKTWGNNWQPNWDNWDDNNVKQQTIPQVDTSVEEVTKQAPIQRSNEYIPIRQVIAIPTRNIIGAPKYIRIVHRKSPLNTGIKQASVAVKPIIGTLYYAKSAAPETNIAIIKKAKVYDVKGQYQQINSGSQKLISNAPNQLQPKMLLIQRRNKVKLAEPRLPILIGKTTGLKASGKVKLESNAPQVIKIKVQPNVFLKEIKFDN